MNGKRFTYVAAMICSCAVAGQVEAQTFLQRLGEQLNQQLTPPPPPPADTLPPPRESVPTNSVSRASLGIKVGPVTEEVVRDQRLVVRRGAVITALEQGSAADRAGLPLGAVIVALDGRRIDSPEDLVQSVQAARPGQDVELTYYDHNKLARKKVHLAAVSGAGLVAVPNEPTRPLIPAPASTIPGSPSSPSSPLERELGGGGSRPLLGRIGRAIDNFATPAQAVGPAEPTITNRIEPDSEVAVLRQQLAELTKQVDSLLKQVASLEQKMSEKK